VSAVHLRLIAEKKFAVVHGAQQSGLNAETVDRLLIERFGIILEHRAVLAGLIHGDMGMLKKQLARRAVGRKTGHTETGLDYRFIRSQQERLG
jgi:hypothetical protein